MAAFVSFVTSSLRLPGELVPGGLPTYLGAAKNYKPKLENCPSYRNFLRSVLKERKKERKKERRKEGKKERKKESDTDPSGNRAA